MSDQLYRIEPWDWDYEGQRMSVSPQEQLVPVEVDYETLAGHLQDSDDDAGVFVASMEAYRELAHIYAKLLGIGGDDAE